MAELRLQLVGAHPSGPGLAALLRSHVRPGDFVTASDDRRLKAAAELIGDVEDVEFCPFIELVGRFLDMMGLPRGRVASPTQQVAALAAILPGIPEESPLYASRKMPGLHKLAADRLSDLRMWGGDAEMLAALTPAASEGLAEKLRTLTHLDLELRSLFDKLGREFSADRIRRCLDAPAKQQFPIKRIVAIYGGDENPIFERWLAWAAAAGVEVECILEWRIGGGMFVPSSRAADRMGKPILEHDMEPGWHDAVFTTREAEAPPRCILASAPDPLSECEWALRQCLDLRKAEVLDHRIVIFARDAELYGPLLHAAAERCALPLKANWSVPLLSSGFARLVLSIFQIASGPDVRAIHSLAKSSYLNCPADLREELWENLTLARRAGDEQWERIAEWAETHADRFPWLIEFLHWRKDAVGGAATLAVWLERLRLFPPKLGIVANAARLEQTSTRDHSAFNVLQSSLREVALVAQGNEMREFSLRELTRLAETTWEEAMIAPSTQNKLGINFVSSTETLSSYHTVIALGMLEGSFPRRRAEDPLLSDGDIAELRMISGGRIDLPDSFERAAQERDEFLRLVGCAEEQIWLSTPQADESQDNIPAFYIDELGRVMGSNASRKSFARTELTPPEAECTNMADLNLARALAADKHELSRPTVEADAARAMIMPNLEAGVPVEELQDALACPFLAVFRHELRVTSVRRRRLASFLRDVPRLAGLSTAANPESAVESLKREVDRVLEDHGPEIEPWEARLLRLAAERWMPEWVRREFAARAIWPRVQESISTDVKLGEGSLRNDAGRPGEIYRYTGRAEAAWEGEDYAAASLWLSDTPTTGFQDEDADYAKDDRLKIGLWLMALFGGGSVKSAVEVDSVSGPRRLFFLGKDPLPRRRNGDEVMLSRVGESSTFFRPVKAARQEAVRRLRMADARPTPKEDWCRNCSYGELCRSSSEFGEVLGIFDGEGE